MIVCPNCNHTNPEGATQCEACYTALPQMMPCPNCGTSIQTDAVFCGQCGYNLQPATVNASEEAEIPSTQVISSPTADVSDLPDNPDSVSSSPWDEDDLEETQENAPVTPSTSEASSSEPEPIAVSPTFQPDPIPDPPEPEPIAVSPTSQPNPSPDPPEPVPVVPKVMATQLQVQKASLLHVQTQTTIDRPNNLSVIHIGKPNEQIPPDVDVSGFANAEVVSRVHADIRVEGDNYYLEDMGSSNGTYVNHTPLPSGNRHCLRQGDRISLGKGDLVTFIFQR